MLEVHQLRKYFTIRHDLMARFHHPDHIVRAVDGVSFSVGGGEIFGIIGESGSGKTTLAKCMLRLHDPTVGEVLFQDKNILMMTKNDIVQFRRKVQPIFQDADSTLDPRQNVSSILKEPLFIHHLGNRSERKRLVSDVMEKVNLPSSLLSRYPSELSGGQRQRVAIARALLLAPDIIVADEPASGLDPIVATQILDLLISLKELNGVTLVFISHDLGTISYASDRIAVMHRGKIVELIDGERFEKDARHPYTRFLKGIEQRASKLTLPQDIHHIDYLQEEGCGYAELCPHSTSYCYQVSPELRQVSSWLQVACHMITN